MAHPVETGRDGIKFNKVVDALIHPERKWTVVKVDNLVTREDVDAFYEWSQDRETARHLVPNFRTIQKADEYYRQDRAVFLVARNFYGEPIGVLTVKREPYLKTSRRVAYCEKMIVSPDFQAKKEGKGRNIGKTLFATMLDGYVFAPDPLSTSIDLEDKPRLRFEECRGWIMTDQRAGDWRRNYHFFITVAGTQIVRDRPLWSQYAREVYGVEDDREALWLYTNPELWENAKRRARERGFKLEAAPLELVRKVSL